MSISNHGDFSFPIISYQAITGNNNNGIAGYEAVRDYIIPSDNWEQQLNSYPRLSSIDYIIPSDNWEQQPSIPYIRAISIISYQAITGNNNNHRLFFAVHVIISYQAITGNNNRRERKDN